MGRGVKTSAPQFTPQELHGKGSKLPLLVRCNRLYQANFRTFRQHQGTQETLLFHAGIRTDDRPPEPTKSSLGVALPGSSLRLCQEYSTRYKITFVLSCHNINMEPSQVAQTSLASPLNALLAEPLCTQRLWHLQGSAGLCQEVRRGQVMQ